MNNVLIDTMTPIVYIGKLVELVIVSHTEFLFNPGRIFFHKIEQTGAAPQCGFAISLTAAFAKQTFKHQSRMRLSRKRRGGRRPR